MHRASTITGVQGCKAVSILWLAELPTPDAGKSSEFYTWHFMPTSQCALSNRISKSLETVTAPIHLATSAAFDPKRLTLSLEITVNYHTLGNPLKGFSQKNCHCLFWQWGSCWIPLSTKKIKNQGWTWQMNWLQAKRALCMLTQHLRLLLCLVWSERQKGETWIPRYF